MSNNYLPFIGKLFTITLIGLIIYSCSTSKKDYTYYDIDNQEISRSKFRKKRSTNKYLDIQIDSLNQRKLIKRTKTGKIDNIEVYRSLISNKSSEKLDFSKPLVILYYPGKDPCNSSGLQTEEFIRNWYSSLESGIQQLNANNPVYLYKDKEGLEKYEGLINWYKDPDGITERLFFNNHYPCSSFVVISPKGDYVSYFGEYGPEYVWKAVKLVSK
ncbi:hypothetical protein GCM10023115_41540 [Pontixanthobacter gangjinensis]